MRLFLAVTPPIAARREMVAAVASARGELRGRWVPADNLHITLAFLGEVDLSRLDEIAAAAEETARDGVRFELELGGLDAFPNPRRARVAVLGARLGEAALLDLARRLRARLPEDLRPDDRKPLRAHLTIGRFKQPPPLEGLECLGRELAPLSWRFPVDTVELYQSELHPDGARYTRRGGFLLPEA